jgi:hypothetical protein
VLHRRGRRRAGLGPVIEAGPAVRAVSCAVE